jgi:hypothetical protein
MGRIGALLSLLIYLFIQPSPLAVAAAGEAGFTILYSNSINGETDPCG